MIGSSERIHVQCMVKHKFPLFFCLVYFPPRGNTQATIMSDPTDTPTLFFMQSPPCRVRQWIKAVVQAIVLLLLSTIAVGLFVYLVVAGRAWMDTVLFVITYTLVLASYVGLVVFFAIQVLNVLQRRVTLKKTSLVAPALLCLIFVAQAGVVFMCYLHDYKHHTHLGWHSIWTELSVKEAMVVGTIICAAVVDLVIMVLAVAVCLHPDYNIPQLPVGYYPI